MTDVWPKSLAAANGPMRADKLEGAVEGMGQWGQHATSLAAAGWVQPDMMTGLTLFILSSQPRNPERAKRMPGGGGGVAGGVWVREQFTIHQPLPSTEAFVVTGNALGRYVRKGRRYGINQSHTVDAQGAPVATNLTTGLLAYRVDADLADGFEGTDPHTLAAVGPDWQAAPHNPDITQLRGLSVGDMHGDYDVAVSLALMQARDTKKPDNPIHSDPELARRAGLEKPIAGGSHVLAFALECVMQLGGQQCLLHGAAFDIRWKAPVHADAVMRPRAQVAQTQADRVVFDVTATLADGATAMTGQITVPLA